MCVCERERYPHPHPQPRMRTTNNISSTANVAHAPIVQWRCYVLKQFILNPFSKYFHQRRFKPALLKDEFLSPKFFQTLQKEGKVCTSKPRSKEQLLIWREMETFKNIFFLPVKICQSRILI